jgi:ketosteroid isomerase-like protein
MILKLILTIVSLSVLALCAENNADKLNINKTEDLEKIKQLHETDIAASKAGVIDTLLSLRDEDAVKLAPGEPPTIGLGAIMKGMGKYREEVKNYQIIEYNHDFKEIKIIDGWAFEWGIYTGSYKSSAEGETIRESAKLFRVLKKQKDGSWKVSHAIWNNNPLPD